MGIPKHCGMVELTQNIEGLRTHGLMVSMFVTEPNVTAEARKWRAV